MMPKEPIACLYTLISTETEVQHVEWQQKTAINSIYFHICIEIEVQSLSVEEVFLQKRSVAFLFHSNVHKHDLGKGISLGNDRGPILIPDPQYHITHPSKGKKT